MDTTMIDPQVQVDSSLKVDSQRRQLMPLHHSHQINQLDKAVTIIQHKQTPTSQQHLQVEQLVIHQALKDQQM